jgi:hypothetical protein
MVNVEGLMAYPNNETVNAVLPVIAAVLMLVAISDDDV